MGSAQNCGCSCGDAPGPVSADSAMASVERIRVLDNDLTPQESARYSTYFNSFQHGTFDEFEQQDALRSFRHHSSQSHVDCNHCGENSALFEVIGPSIHDYRDPLRLEGGIRGGLCDVDGNGRIDCNDLHDALFLDYPVEHPPVPDHSEERFRTLQSRYQELLKREIDAEDEAYARDGSEMHDTSYASSKVKGVLEVADNEDTDTMPGSVEHGGTGVTMFTRYIRTRASIMEGTYRG